MKVYRIAQVLMMICIAAMLLACSPQNVVDEGNDDPENETVFIYTSEDLPLMPPQNQQVIFSPIDDDEVASALIEGKVDVMIKNIPLDQVALLEENDDIELYPSSNQVFLMRYNTAPS
ncbi:MAG: hypothetical protein ACOCWQ_06050, partial [Nanoarchaeota archaeon]